MYLSIIVPCYNEGKECFKAVEKLKTFLFGKKINDYELIFVNDGSKDDTLECMEEIKAKYPNGIKIVSYTDNKGKGYAVRKGMEVATGDYIFFLDADMAVHLSFVPTALKELQNGSDVVMASRRLPNSSTGDKVSFVRKIVSKGCVICTKLIVPGFSFSDTQCGGKAFKKEVVETILPYLRFDGFSFDLEIIAYCILNNYKIKEVPAIVNNRIRDSKVSVVEDSIKFFKDLFVIRKIIKNK